MSITVLLTITHVIGTVLGFGGAVFAEIFFINSTKDGKINKTESSFLRITYSILRIGMFLVLFSGFGYLLYYRIIGAESLLYSPIYWAKMIIITVIAFNAVLMSAKLMPMWLGSAVSITSWTAAMVLGVWRTLDASLLTIIIFYVAVIFIVAFSLEIIKKRLAFKQ